MPNNLKFFAEKYDQAIWHTVRMLLVVMILSIISTIGLWNLSLGELKEQIELAKQLQERWNNHLNPDMKKGGWTAEEDLQLLELFLKYDRKWTSIAAELGCRTANSAKNRINSLIIKEKQLLDTANSADITQRLIQKLRSTLNVESK